jgi:hypothetical protein
VNIVKTLLFGISMLYDNIQWTEDPIWPINLIGYITRHFLFVKINCIIPYFNRSLTLFVWFFFYSKVKIILEI